MKFTNVSFNPFSKLCEGDAILFYLFIFHSFLNYIVLLGVHCDIYKSFYNIS
jgi:hypothetical protein